MDEIQQDEVRLIIYRELGTLLKELYAELSSHKKSAEDIIHEAYLDTQRTITWLENKIRLAKEEGRNSP